MALNTSAREREATFELSSFGTVDAVARAIRTSGSMAEGEHWASLADIPLSGKTLSTPLKGNSITTFIISGVE